METTQVTHHLGLGMHSVEDLLEHELVLTDEGRQVLSCVFLHVVHDEFRLMCKGSQKVTDLNKVLSLRQLAERK